MNIKEITQALSNEMEKAVDPARVSRVETTEAISSNSNQPTGRSMLLSLRDLPSGYRLSNEPTDAGRLHRPPEGACWGRGIHSGVVVHRDRRRTNSL